MPKRRKKQRPPANPYAPKYWSTWMLVGVAWVITRLPLAWIRNLGHASGDLLYRFGTSRRNITLRNLELCFPELDATERSALARRVFRSVGIGGLELMIPWLHPQRDLRPHFTLRGVEHLEAAVAEGRGVILIGAHWAVMDVISQPLGDLGSVDVMYRYNKNPVWEWLQVSGRQRYFTNVIERSDTRGVLKALKSGRAIWYAPDQDYGPKHSVFAPFFGIDTATITATSRFARLNNSPVVFLRQHRDEHRMHWHLEFSAPLDNFPSDDEQADAARMNAILEAEIRKAPHQYLWLHKRFKTRPTGTASLYD
ncbi:MAG: LpxL/LpxP family Kdo(2)-lipid IV(A) lauroyl/palmitoleoyl acyltransferase [Pseudomonadota bacterium]